MDPARSPTPLLLGYAALLALGGVALVLAAPGNALGFTPHVGLPLLLLGFCVAILAPVSLSEGRETHVVTFTEIPFVLGLFLATPPDLALASVTSMVVTSVAVWRSPAVKVTVSAAASALYAGVGIALFRLLVGQPDTLSPLTWGAALAAVLVASTVEGLSVEAAIAVRSGRVHPRTIARNVLQGLPIEATNVVLGLVGVLVLTEQPLAGVLLLVVAVALYALYQGYHLMRQRSSRLEALYEFTGAVDRSVANSAVALTVSEEARRLLRADTACVALRIGGQVRHIAGSASLTAETWWRPAADGSVVRLPRTRGARPAPGLRDTPHQDGMAVPLFTDEGPTGALVVADRLDAVSTFDTNDLALIQALAGHASVALANARLMEQVRADALTRERLARFDELTGLPNRASFREQLLSAIAGEGAVSVVLMDIDRFKDVNDTLGHHIGDEMLREVGERLRASAGERYPVARLGGDEFAVLVREPPVVPVDAVADRLLDAVAARPLSISGFDLGIRASAGVAYAQGGESATQLLRHAEIAMYDAKRRGLPRVRYSAHRDPYDERRLQLAADLEGALRRGEIGVHYQPQIDLSSRRVLGLEALARWTHPEFGEVPPSEFVPVAARAGLMRPLTRYVLHRALSDLRGWQLHNLPLTMSVNVSTRNLLERRLADDVEDMLAEHHVPASALVLEITESEIMAEPEDSVVLLRRLAEVGLTLSVDDFGTGHSSLLRLRSLPIGEVKIDRAFVHGVLGSPGDSAIIRSVIDLGHNLGMRVVAEGVETEDDLEVLRGWDCDMAQGFLLARPMPAEDAGRWLNARTS